MLDAPLSRTMTGARLMMDLDDFEVVVLTGRSRLSGPLHTSTDTAGPDADSTVKHVL